MTLLERCHERVVWWDGQRGNQDEAFAGIRQKMLVLDEDVDRTGRGRQVRNMVATLRRLAEGLNVRRKRRESRLNFLLGA